MAGACVDQRERKSDSIARLGRDGVGPYLYSHRPLHHIGVVSAAPEVPPSTSDRAIHRDRPIDFRHVATLANEAPLLHEELAFVFRVSPARSHVIKLGWPGHDIVTAITDLRRPEIRIELGRVRGGRIFERSVDDSVPHMTGRAGHR